jgi:predicted DNA-binding transcriptional regulator YafY
VRRADRLFRITQFLRKKRFATAAQLAEVLGVHVRTVYRDVRDLQKSGVPITGEAGVGYAISGSFDLPPLMFNEEEIEAVVLGVRVVRAWGDASLDRAAASALEKIEAALPERLRKAVDAAPLHAPSFHVARRFQARLETLRKAIKEGRKVNMTYTDKHGAGTTRGAIPLGLFFWGTSWSLAAWCELRVDYRSFRLDRIVRCEMGEKTAPLEVRTLGEFLARMRSREVGA